MQRQMLCVMLAALYCACGSICSQANTVVIDRDHPARQARLHAGDTLIIKLRAQTGLGYKWVLGKTNNQVLTLTGVTTAPADPRVLGGPMDQTFRFHAIGDGHALIHLTLMHKASGITAIAKHYRCDVRVRSNRS